MSHEIARFLDLLTRRGLLSNRVLANLHRQVAEKGERGKTVPLEALAKLLVEKGHLTRHQADAIVTECRRPQREVDSELELAPIDEDRPWQDAGPAVDDRSDAALAETRAATDDLSEAQAAALLQPIDESPEYAPPETQPTGPATTRRPLADASMIEELPIETAKSGRRSAKREKRNVPKSEWDSPLLLVGGGALLVLVLVGGLVWYLVRIDTGNAQLQAARTAYEDGAYSQAIDQYERFLAAHGGHDEASAARVQLGLARIRRTLDTGAAFEDVLAQSQQVIAEIEREPAFVEAGRELAAILPEIAEGLAARARQAEDHDAAAELTTKTEAALALLLNTKYVPKSFRPVERIEDVKSTLASVQRRQERQRDLADALSGISAALDKPDYEEAYGLYRRLVEKHSDAAQIEEVINAAKSIASAEADAIQFQPEQRAAATDERSDQDVDSVLLATTLQEGAADGERTTAFMRIEGALFAVDAGSGDFLWRRYVGVAPQLPPLTTPVGDALVIDVEHGEVLRLAGRTGKLIWRQMVGDVVGNAAISSDRLLIPTANSRLVFVDLATGEAQGYVQFAQPLATTPAIDPGTNRIFVVGEHSSVYVVAEDSLRGEGAIFVGHAAGNVTVPPAAYGQTICVVENFAVDRSRLHVFSFMAEPSAESSDGNGREDDTSLRKAWRASAPPIRLTGRVTTPMATAGRRIAVTTDLGEIRVFDVSTVAGGPPLTPIASRDAGGLVARTNRLRGDRGAVDRYVVLNENDLWLADTRLARMKVLAAGGRLQAQDLARVYNGDAFTHPLIVVGDRIIHVRRPRGRAGYLVAATDMRSGDALWECEAAVGPVDLSLLPEGQLLAVAMANGRLYQIDVSALRLGAMARGQLGSQLIATDRVSSVNFCGEWAVANSTGWSAGDDETQPAEDLFLLPLNQVNAQPLPLALPASLASRPRAFGGGLLVPLEIGQVLLLDPSGGDSLAAPFQPAIHPAQLPEWTDALIVEPDLSFVIADRRGTVYRVSIERNPDRMTLVEESEPLAATVRGELCATSSSVIAATDDRRIVVLRMSDLVQTDVLQLKAPTVWGPFAAADRVLFATADDRLHCLAHDGAELAQASTSAPAVGRPIAFDDRSIAVALENGTLLRVDAAGRSVAALGDAGQPLAVGPLLLNDRACAATPDGALILLPVDLPVRADAVAIAK